MPSGGSRKGAGRKPGSQNKTPEQRKAEEAASKIKRMPVEPDPQPLRTVSKRSGPARRIAAREQKTPLDLMIKRMLSYWNESEKETGAKADALADKAVAIAKDAAPYMHPRLSSVEAKVEVEQAKTLSDSALDGELVGLLHAIKQEQPDDDAQRAPVH